jgi:hypothetical protein
LLARWSIFHEFIKVAKKYYGPDLFSNDSDIKYQWLLFQVFPLVRVYGSDPFEALSIECFVGVELEVLESLNTITVEKSSVIIITLRRKKSSSSWTKPR